MSEPECAKVSTSGTSHPRNTTERPASRVVGQFESGVNTPKALANFSPELERSDNPGSTNGKSINPERVNIAHA